MANKINIKRFEMPKLGSFSKIAGKAASKLALGYYKPGLGKAGKDLSSNVKPGDLIKVSKGIAFVNDKPIVMDTKLFNGIERSNIPVTQDMCSPKGMKAALRWDIIGSAPEFWAKGAGLAGSAYWGTVGAGELSSMLYNGNISGGDVASFLVTSLLFIPYHRIIRAITGTNDSKIMLSNVEDIKMNVVEKKRPGLFEKGEPLIEGGDTFPDLFNKIAASGYILDGEEGLTLYIYGKKDDPAFVNVITHEKSHLMGASEYSAYRVTYEKSYKEIFYTAKTFKDRLKALKSNLAPFLASLASLGMNNFMAIYYGLRTGDMARYYRENLQENKGPKPDKPNK